MRKEIIIWNPSWTLTHFANCVCCLGWGSHKSGLITFNGTQRRERENYTQLLSVKRVWREVLISSVDIWLNEPVGHDNEALWVIYQPTRFHCHTLSKEMNLWSVNWNNWFDRRLGEFCYAADDDDHHQQHQLILAHVSHASCESKTRKTTFCFICEVFFCIINQFVFVN